MIARLNALLRRLPPGAVYLLGLLPLGWIVWLTLSGGIGVDPVKGIEHRLGKVGLWFLVGGLAITPALRLTRLNLIRYRRAVGLLAFFYIALHLVAWVWLDMGLRWAEMAADLAKRPYVILGMLGFVALIPLALTSTNAAIRRMGPVAWGRLHRLAYVAILAGLAHLALLSKVWTVEVLAYLALGLLLLATRLLPRRKPRASLAS